MRTNLNDIEIHRKEIINASVRMHHLPINSLTYLLINSLTHLFINSLTYLFINSLTYLGLLRAGSWHRRHRQPPKAPNFRGRQFYGKEIFFLTKMHYTMIN